MDPHSYLVPADGFGAVDVAGVVRAVVAGAADAVEVGGVATCKHCTCPYLKAGYHVSTT